MRYVGVGNKHSRCIRVCVKHTNNTFGSLATYRNRPLCSLTQMKHVISTSYTPPVDASGVVALMALDQWLEAGLKLEEGKYGLGFPFMYLLLTGTFGLKVRKQASVQARTVQVYRVKEEAWQNVVVVGLLPPR